MPGDSDNSGKRFRKRLVALEERIGIAFSDDSHLERALTHSSARGKAESGFHYERLEFLGDRVLALSVADMLMRSFPEADEGELSLRFNSLVNRATLAGISDELGLPGFIRAGSDVKNLEGRGGESIRADALEALIASIYLDSGLEAASGFVERFWTSRMLDAKAGRRDPKTHLQEWTQASGLGMPLYEEVSREGPDHAPRFLVSVRVEGLPEARGSGHSKREAEREAARSLLEREGVESVAEESSS